MSTSARSVAVRWDGHYEEIGFRIALGFPGPDLLGTPRELALSVELYVAAAPTPALRAVTQAWMLRSRRALELHFDPVTARELDALIEGLVLHSALSTDPMTPEQIRHAIHRFTR